MIAIAVPLFVYCWRSRAARWTAGRKGSHRFLRRWPLPVWFALLLAVGPAAAQPAADSSTAAGLARLRVLRGQYPAAFFFRSSEGFVRSGRLSWQRWDAAFSRLMGIEGKVLDEEVPGTSVRNIEYFTRFKRQHPDQLVLLHYNGNARDPRYQTEPFFAGHWLYYEGQRLLDDLPAEEGISEIRVAHPNWFRVNMGRYRTSNDDIGICELDDDGKPDWHRAEQLQLVSVDAQRKTIRVRRGCYGTRPRAFRAGRAYLAVHVTEGPWGRRSHLLWHYNYARCCPRDEQGRTCAEVHAKELAARFSPGRELAALDGLEFDVLQHTKRQYRPRGAFPGADCDGDGKADAGMIGGVDQYTLGVLDFLADVRRQLGPEKLILADGHGLNNQRGFGILNGIESEGWPTLRDFHMRDWSGGLNRHAFWAARGWQPAFSYINHKYVVPGPQPGQLRRPEYPMGINRLVFAAAVFTDSAVCYSLPPRAEPGEVIGIWDELQMGTEHRPGWLGRPLGPPVRMALDSPDLLEGRFERPNEDWPARLAADQAELRADGRTLRAAATDPSAQSFRFRLPGLATPGGDLFVSLTASCEPMSPYPPSMARLLYVGVETGQRLIEGQHPPVTGMQRRGEAIRPIDPASGALARAAGSVELGGSTHAAMRVHPPYRDGKTGMVYWERQLQIAPGSVLRFWTGMGPKAPGRSDGVVFSVRVLAAGEAGTGTKIFQHQQVASRWIEHRVPLNRYAGKTARLRFVADAGPRDNAVTDHGYWGDVQIVAADADGRLPRSYSQRAMTWVDGKPFTSGFYFRQVPAGKVDLVFEVEGPQAAYLHKLSVHAAPDVIYRRFEHGLVVANPSDKPVQLQVSRVMPGANLRRLKGSPNQDPQTNNGQPVGERLTLPPLDALFLVRTDSL